VTAAAPPPAGGMIPADLGLPGLGLPGDFGRWPAWARIGRPGDDGWLSRARTFVSPSGVVQERTSR
jgi:hypothetical protein